MHKEFVMRHLCKQNLRREERIALIKIWEIWEVDGIGRRLCSVTSFGVSSAKPSEQSRVRF